MRSIFCAGAILAFLLAAFWVTQGEVQRGQTDALIGIGFAILYHAERRRE